jgi:hypothetical protein
VSTYVHKIGATLDLVGALALDGQPQNMTGWLARSHLRGPAGVIELNCSWLDAAAGVLSIGALATEQAAWAPGRYAVDVRLEAPDGTVLISNSRDVQLVQAVTQ